jgi:hypothetical protein
MLSVPAGLLPAIPAEPPNVPYRFEPAKPKAAAPNQSTLQFDGTEGMSISDSESELNSTLRRHNSEEMVPVKRERGDGPLKWSLRPEKQKIESLIITTEKSSAKEGEPWSLHDDIRLIRLKECAKLRWPQIRTYFPNRKNDAAEKRYVDYLRASKVRRKYLSPSHEALLTLSLV